MNRTLFTASIAAGVILAGVMSAAFLSQEQHQGQSTIGIGPTVHVSAERPNDQFYEVQLAADPANANHLLGCSMVLTRAKSAYNSVVYASFDGGATWDLRYELDRGPYTDDPTCTYGPDGTAYAAFIAEDKGPLQDEMHVVRSKDAGRSWRPVTVLRRLDREYVTVDRTRGKYDGRLYLHGNGSVPSMQGSRSGVQGFNAARGRIAAFTVRTSVDQGATFGAPAQLVVTGNGGLSAVSNAAVLSEGTFVALFGEVLDITRRRQPRDRSSPNMLLRAAASHDGGETLQAPATVSDWFMNNDIELGTSTIMPALAADSTSGPFRDRLYAVWPDVRSGRNEILFSHSSDKGKSWSLPRVVNDDWQWLGAPGPDADMPQVAVNMQGVVGVTWYDRRNSPGNVGWSVRFTASIDGGDSFLPSVKVSQPARGSDRDVLGLEALVFGGRNPYAYMRDTALRIRLSPSRFTFNGGHTGGLAADAKGGFHPFWVDNRSGVSQIYTTRIAVEGKAVRNGSTDLEALEDVSEYVALQLGNAEYAAATRTVKVDASLLNTSDFEIAGPFQLRALQVTSAAAAVTVVNADNTSSGNPVWDFTTLLETRTLAPGQRSKSKQLEFRLSEPAVIRPSESLARTGLVTITAKILGRVPQARSSPGGH